MGSTLEVNSPHHAHLHIINISWGERADWDILMVLLTWKYSIEMGIFMRPNCKMDKLHPSRNTSENIGLNISLRISIHRH